MERSLQAQTSLNKISVLLVNDNALFRDCFKALLGLNQDINIVGEVADGNEAVDKVQNLNPDVVVICFPIPEIDGLATTRNIFKQNPRVKILIVSNHCDDEYVISSIKAGAAGFIPKQATGQDVVTAIRTLYNGEYFFHPLVTSILVNYCQGYRETNHCNCLTDTEMEILKLIAQGHTSREIADRISISLRIVQSHRYRIMTKLAMRKKYDLIRYAVRNGLIAEESIGLSRARIRS